MYAVYRTPRHGSSLFVNCVNYFGRAQGFARLLQLLEVPEAAPASTTAATAGAAGSAAGHSSVPPALVVAVLKLFAQLSQVHKNGLLFVVSLCLFVKYVQSASA